MKTSETTNTSGEKLRKMTLKDYYDALPSATCPKKEFIREVMRRTGMSDSAVRTWIKYGMRPNNPENVRTLSELTGIREEELWTD